MPEFYVPEVIDELTSNRILCTELIDGTPVDKISNLSQERTNEVSTAPDNFTKACSAVFQQDFFS